MAMLAAPRVKQKFSINPRGAHWSNDDSKFGQKLMEKFGWRKGKGLGAKEDGNTEHVKVSVKSDNKGVGCSNSYADNWIAHQDEFNELLSNLNQVDNDADSETAPDYDNVQSLEAKSKTSRSRVHYKKFTKGKDLSSRSAEDLDCIFGKRKSKSESNTPVIQSVENSGDEEADTKLSHGINIIKSTDSVQEYFAKKMAELKKKNVGGQSDPRKENDDPCYIDQSKQALQNHKDLESDHEDGQPVSFHIGDMSDEEKVQEVKKCKKKKKKEKKKGKEKIKEVEMLTTDTTEIDSDAKTSNKRKRKSSTNEESLSSSSKNLKKSTESDEIENNESSIDENMCQRKKSKKAKKSKKEKEPEESENSEMLNRKLELRTENDEEMKKLTRSNEIENSESTTDADRNRIKKSKKAKKLREKESEDNENSEMLNDHLDLRTENDQEIIVAKDDKRKKKKQKKCDDDIDDIKESELSENEQTVFTVKSQTNEEFNRIAEAFKGSNICDITGYGSSGNTVIKIGKKKKRKPKKKQRK